MKLQGKILSKRNGKMGKAFSLLIFGACTVGLLLLPCSLILFR